MTLTDVMNIESAECDTTAYYRSLQSAINSGTAWTFQGSYGRAAMRAIEDGYCALGHKSTRDYWGNIVPSRHDVVAGTKGSVAFVEACGNEVLDD